MAAGLPGLLALIRLDAAGPPRLAWSFLTLVLSITLLLGFWSLGALTAGAVAFAEMLVRSLRTAPSAGQTGTLPGDGGEWRERTWTGWGSADGSSSSSLI